MIQLGKKLNNPFTLENVQQAYSNLVQQGVMKSGIEIIPTHEYIRSLPADFTQLHLLKKDTLIKLYDYSLEHEIAEGGVYYYDMELDEDVYPITWQYFVVPVNYTLPVITSQLISKLVLFDDSGKGIENAVKAPFNREEWDLIEAEALRLTGISDEVENDLKSRWTPSGKIMVWDDVLQQHIPVVGAEVRAKWSIFTHTGLTDINGDFVVDGNFKSGRKVHYSIKWERPNWDILEKTTFWRQAYFTGPEQNTSWFLQIGSSNDGDRSMRFATLHRALQRYFHSARLDLRKPYDPCLLCGKLNVGYRHDNTGTSNAIPVVPAFGHPHVIVYGKAEGSTTWKPTNHIFATAIHEISHVAHYELIGRLVFSNVWDNKSTRIVSESWSDAVEWGLTNLEYNSLGITHNNNAAMTYNHWGIYPNKPGGNQDWNRSLVDPTEPDDNDRFYTPLYIDMVDNLNQRTHPAFGNGNILFPNDNVSGYTFGMLEDKIVRNTFGLHSLRSSLKNNKPNGVTDAQIDQIIDSYTNLP